MGASCSLDRALHALDFHSLTQCARVPDLGSAQGGRMISGTRQVLHAVCSPPPPIPWGLQQSAADRAEGQQVVRELCEAPWRQETLGLM